MHLATAAAPAEADRATHVEAAPAAISTQSASPYIESLSDWIAISIRGHQESGRQRL
jgi:hypothetical protein